METDAPKEDKMETEEKKDEGDAKGVTNSNFTSCCDLFDLLLFACICKKVEFVQSKLVKVYDNLRYI